MNTSSYRQVFGGRKTIFVLYPQPIHSKKFISIIYQSPLVFMRPGKMSVPSMLTITLLRLCHRNGYPRTDTQFTENRKSIKEPHIHTWHKHDIYESSTHEFLIVIRRTQELIFWPKFDSPNLMLYCDVCDVCVYRQKYRFSALKLTQKYAESRNVIQTDKCRRIHWIYVCSCRTCKCTSICGYNATMARHTECMFDNV